MLLLDAITVAIPANEQGSLLTRSHECLYSNLLKGVGQILGSTVITNQWRPQMYWLWLPAPVPGWIIYIIVMSMATYRNLKLHVPPQYLRDCSIFTTPSDASHRGGQIYAVHQTSVS